MPKKKNSKPKTTVNVDAVRREAKKMQKETEAAGPKPAFGLPGMGEVAPGTLNRQSALEQEMGTRKYRDMIHDHNSKNKHILDRLPFTFPKKKVVRSHLDVPIECTKCGYQKYGSEHTIGFVCPTCKTYVRANNPEAERRGYDPGSNVGIFGTAEDKLRLREERKKKK